MAARIRLTVDVTLKKTSFEQQGGSPSVWNNSPLNVEFGIFANGVIRSPSDFSSIVVMIKPKTRRGASLTDVTIAAAAFNITLTADEWTAGTLYHGVAEFAAQDMQVDLQTKDKDTYWIAIYGLDLVTGEPVMLGGTSIVIEESGINLEGNNPTQGANIVPGGAVYDGSGNYTLAVSEDTSYTYTQGANDDTLVNGVQTLSADGFFTANGASVTLTGTIGAAVTAVIRTPVYPTYDQVRALVGESVILAVNEAGVTTTYVSPDGTRKVTVGCNNNGNFDTIPATNP